jgi:hypothetical protein
LHPSYSWHNPCIKVPALRVDEGEAVQRYGSRAPISLDPAGTLRWHLNRAVAVRDSEGNILRFVGTSTDVHDSRLAQEELRDTQAELAHVTRVPVNEAVPQTRAIGLAKARCAGPARGGSVFRRSSSWAM